jgi:hypothetical protein
MAGRMAAGLLEEKEEEEEEEGEEEKEEQAEEAGNVGRTKASATRKVVATAVREI